MFPNELDAVDKKKYIKKEKIVSTFGKEPTYDEAKRLFDAGCTFGVGKRNKIGTEGNPRGKMAIPQESKAFSMDEYA